jgi:hypothetical protein
MRYFFIVLVAFIQFAANAGGASQDGLWGSQAVAVATASESALVLRQGRFPFVVYLDKNSNALRSVEWREGEKQDKEMFKVDWATSTLRLAAHGDRVGVAWQVLNQATGNGTIYYSELVSGDWSTPEAIFQGLYPPWDLAMTPEGTPLVAVASRGWNTSTVRLVTRGTEGWMSNSIANVNRSISNVALTLDAAGVPTVGWRAYSSYSGGPPDQIQYARRDGVNWVQQDALGASLLDALFTGPDGSPCLIARGSGSVPFFLPLSGNGGAATPISASTAGAADAASSPDGTIYVIVGDFLAIRRDGVWSEIPCPWLRNLATGLDGSVHFLGQNGLLYYGTMLPGEASKFQPLTTYEQGSAVLDDMAIHPDGQPRIFGGLGDSRKYSQSGDTWVSQAVSGLGLGWLHAYDHGGRLRAFSGYGYYAVEQPNGTMSVSALPVGVSSGSSSSLYAFLLGNDGAPHAGFFTGLGTSSAAVRYAVKRGESWTVETVAPGEFSDQHCSLALDPAGVPWMFTSRGLFRRTESGWVHEYQTSGAKFPGLGIASDGTVHAVFWSGVSWRSLTGNNGTYGVKDFDTYHMPNTVPGFAMAGDRPLLAYGRRLSYSPTREAIVLAEKIDGEWRLRHLTELTWDGEVGDKLQLAATAEGRWTLAGGFRELRNNYYRNVLFVCQGELPRFDAGTHPVLQSIASGGGRRFQLDLKTGPFLAPLQLQGSATLDRWMPILDLGPAFRIHTGVEGLSLRGDPFRSRVEYELPAGLPAWFVRLSGNL